MGVGEGTGEGGGKAMCKAGANCLIWFIVLWLISFFVACFCFPWYILCSVLSPCIGACTKLEECLLKGVKFPNYCSVKMVGGGGLDLN